MSNKNNNRFKSKSSDDYDRRRNNREEKIVKEELPKIVFSFKDIDIGQIPPGQSYLEWQNQGTLSIMVDKLGQICQYNITEAQQLGMLTVYGNFPPKSDFKHPKHINEKVNWAVIKNIKGQKGRLAGHIIMNVFYIVFLDMNHKFYITEKK
ncbi:hypothetical protein N180_01365 [Pedobacter antarcticus 4BY]|uniref:Uncharacterized protein n=2 Tax=Pedobacter antarcticus TaxID=34086 RepID=A0A081PC88_9SPHI|nr:hypothetical protein [Pedobacter antarcticus]KEQ28311.1 hypothetical protein N180_01365 [Pedobacter antarcticus 4BY]SFF07172.1 hypothetical protein SAMN03003324_02349 [Pedobacter antarcticus]